MFYYISITFSVFAQMYNGPNTEAPLIGRFCGSTPPPANATTSSSLHVVFHSDFTVVQTGFQMLWYQNGRIPNITHLNHHNE